MKRLSVMLLVTSAALLTSLSGCKDSNAPESIVGTYTLVSVNGKAPPQVVAADNTGILEITAGRVTLNADKSFTDRTDFRLTQGSTVTTDFDIALGAWSQSGNNVTFAPTGGSTYNMSLSGSSLTQTEGTLTLVYRR